MKLNFFIVDLDPLFSIFITKEEFGRLEKKCFTWSFWPTTTYSQVDQNGFVYSRKRGLFIRNRGRSNTAPYFHSIQLFMTYKRTVLLHPKIRAVSFDLGLFSNHIPMKDRDDIFTTCFDKEIYIGDEPWIKKENNSSENQK
jgi:hypothetical protein